MNALGSVEVRSISFTRFGVPVRVWGPQGGLREWHGGNDVADFEVRDARLRMRATGPDPGFVSVGLLNLQRRCQAVDALLSLFLGFAAGVAQTTILRRFVGWQPSGSLAGVPAPGLRRSWVGTVALVVLSTSVSVGLGYWLYTRFLRGPSRPAAPMASKGYESVLVDRLGHRLSKKEGDLEIVLDPFTIYRNYPGQKTSAFTTDSLGYRGGACPASDRPIAVILGGSTTFGHGLESDGETFSAQLNSLNHQYCFVNAGVVGFVSGQELAEMVHHADRLRPSLYVVVDGWNELYIGLFPHDDGSELGYNWPIFDEIENRLYRLATLDGAPESPQRELRAPADASPSEKEERIFMAYSENLGRMADFARSRGAAFLVAFQPHLGSKRTLTGREAERWTAWLAVYRNTHAKLAEQYDRLRERTAAFCKTKEIPWLDLDGSPRLRDDARELYADSVHPNARGHRVIAELLQERLSSLSTPAPEGKRVVGHQDVQLAPNPGASSVAPR